MKLFDNSKKPSVSNFSENTLSGVVLCANAQNYTHFAQKSEILKIQPFKVAEMSENLKTLDINFECL